MALFGKKKPVEYCAICGKERKTGLLRGLFQTEVEGHYVCSDCYSMVDVQPNIRVEFTLEQLKGYFAYYNENLKLKERFTPTTTVTLGTWGTKILFDRNNGLMSLDSNMKELIFERGCLRSFAIKEDGFTIYEGSPEGLKHYESDTRNQINLMTPEINRFRMERRNFEDNLRRMSPEQREAQENNGPTFALSEPFQRFYVELYFDHPYWTEKTFEMDGPRFDETEPDTSVYLGDYRAKLDTVRCLVEELMAFAFPGAGHPSAPASTAMDAADALIRFKELLDMGVITEEEFAAKKRQLLGL